jgi:hypothetical protein
MKFLGILAAASLALSPAIVTAGSPDKSDDGSRPIAGPTAASPLEDSAVAAPVLVAAGVVLLGALAIGLMGGGDNSVTAGPTTNPPPNGTE